MAKLSPTEAHGGTQPTHWPPTSSALPVVPRSLPSTNQPCDPCRTKAPDCCPPPAGEPKPTALAWLQLSWASGELSTVTPKLLS